MSVFPLKARQPQSDQEGYFGPDSLVWRLDRESVLLFAGGLRALLMQVAHPLVAAAVAEHSRYRSDPIGRLRHTLDVSLSFAFEDRETARAKIQAVNRLHAAVTGRLEEPIGVHGSGATYRAMDPQLLLWVYATLAESTVVCFERFVRPLDTAERDGYWAEGKREGTVWGIPSALFPNTFSDLQAWMAEQIQSGAVRVSPAGREIARQLLTPPAPWIPRITLLPTALVTIWLLPPALRRQFGFTWGPRRERLMRGVASASRAVVPCLPPGLRYMPQYRAARRRLGLR